MSERNTARSQTAILISVLCAAVGIRLLYQTAMLWYGGSFDNGSDSNTYISTAHTLLTTGQLPETDRLPLYAHFLVLVYKVVGLESLRAVVTVQAFIDALSILAIALTAKAFSRKLVLPAAVVGAIAPNFLVHASYILQENVFLLFLSWGLCALVWALRRDNPVPLLITAGVLFGLTLWTRLTLTYFAIFLVPAFAIALRLQLRMQWLRCAALALIPAVTMWLVVTPLLVQNYIEYGHAALSSQSGAHLLNWVYGCLATAWPCANRAAVVDQVRPLINEYIHTGKNHFDLSAFQQKIAFERILQLPLWQIAWGMIWGSIRNVFQTGFYAVLAQFNQPPMFLSAMKGGNFFDRVAEFVTVNKHNGFMMLWGASQVMLVLSRVVQATGAVIGLKRQEFRGMTIVLLSVVAYTLVLNGPFADPKYRIPCEPTFIVLFALGLVFAPPFVSWRPLSRWLQ